MCRSTSLWSPDSINLQTELISTYRSIRLSFWHHICTLDVGDLSGKNGKLCIFSKCFYLVCTFGCQIQGWPDHGRSGSGKVSMRRQDRQIWIWTGLNKPLIILDRSLWTLFMLWLPLIYGAQKCEWEQCGILIRRRQVDPNTRIDNRHTCAHINLDMRLRRGRWIRTWMHMLHSKKLMLIKNKYRKDCSATAIGYRRCCYHLPTFFNWAAGMSVLRLRLSYPVPHPFSRSFGKMARFIIDEKARCRIESYHITSGKVGGEKANENQLVLLMGLTLSWIYLPLSKI